MQWCPWWLRRTSLGRGGNRAKLAWLRVSSARLDVGHALGKQKSAVCYDSRWSSVGSRTLLVGGWIPSLDAVSVFEVSVVSILTP
jgi:hypothetical protein